MADEAKTNLAVTVNANQAKPWLFAILMGLFGAAINSIPLPLLPEIQLILGNAAYVFVAMHLLPRYTLVTAFITLIPVYFIFGHPWGFLTFGLEAWFIATMRSKGWYVLIADMVYWLLIGMPLTCVIIWFQVVEFTSADLFTVFKQGFNGLWYTSIACFFMFIFNEKLKIYWHHQAPTHRTLRAKLMYSLVFVTTTALFGSTLLISNHFIQTSKNLVDKSLQDTSKNIAEFIDLYIEKNQQGLELGSAWLTQVGAQDYGNILTKITTVYPAFKALYLADERGEIQQAMLTTSAYENTLLPSALVASKFGIEQQIGGQSTSPAFKLDGSMAMPMVALNTHFSVATIDSNIQALKQDYVLEGVLDLNQLAKIASAELDNLSVSTVIVDQQQNIIFASPVLNLASLTPFSHQLLENTRYLQLSAEGNKRYVFKSAKTKNGWQVFSLIDQLASSNNVKNEYLSIFIILFFTLIITAYFADQYGRRLTKPLRFIVKQLAKQHSKKMPEAISASSEVIHLYNEIVSNRNKLYQYQEQLEEKVVERTKELNEANKKLEKLALYDGLTQVHNRRYLDDNFALIQKSAERNTALMSLIMVDLDHFKQLNDNYGHLVGDNCLVKVAEILKAAFDRGSDMVVRFGGEEFVIVAPYITPAALATKLEELRKAIEAVIFHTGENELFTVTASFGAVIADASFSGDVLKWVKKADECLYQAKDAGRNCYRITDQVARLND
ncbi:diguanylate cyclase [Thalassotalea agariperforans]